MNPYAAKDFTKEAELLRLLGHPLRLRIIQALLKQESCVKNLWLSLKLPQSLVSQHLNLMKSKNILKSERKGNLICYAIKDPRAIKILELLK